MERKKLFIKEQAPIKLTGLLPVYLIVFISFFDTHAQMPILAPYALSLGATPFLLGLIVGTYSLFNIAGNFTSGALIDKVSWRTPLLTGLAGVTLALLLYPLAESPITLATIRAAHGLMGGILVPAALACLTMGSYNPSYASRLAVFGAVIGLAAVTGPMLSGIIAAKLGYHSVYYCLAVLMAAALLASLYPVLKYDTRLCKIEGTNPGYVDIAHNRSIITAFCFAFGTMGSTGTLASFLPERAYLLGLGPAETGLLFATFALMAIIIQSIWPALIKLAIIKNHRGGAAGLVFITSSMLLVAKAETSTALFLSLAVFGLGFGLAFQGMLGLVITGSEPAWRGRAIGLFFAVYSLGVATVAPLSGLIWQLAPPVYPFYTAALIAMFCVAAGLYAFNKS